jgi:hypothetical protein
VVRRFFDLLKPSAAIFGEKDFQQLKLVEEIAGDVKIIRAPIIREADGLAMSSRNIRLTPEGRAAAAVISQALFASETESELRKALASQPLLTVDYADFIDEESFLPAGRDTAMSLWLALESLALLLRCNVEHLVYLFCLLQKQVLMKVPQSGHKVESLPPLVMVIHLKRTKKTL